MLICELIGTRELQLETKKIIRSNGATTSASLYNLIQTKLRDKGSMISRKWLPKGVMKPFPQNCISLMTISGAKGRLVNFQQISFLLGQQELEGKWVPRMVSGNTLAFHLGISPLGQAVISLTGF